MTDLIDKKHHYRIFRRLQPAAQKETDAVFRALPKELKERVKGISVCFEPDPTPDMRERGVKPEALSLVNRDAREITIFLMNVFALYGKEPGEFREQFRKVLVTELADWAGMQLTAED